VNSQDSTKAGRERWLDHGLAIIVSLATLASAWCAYQSRLWGGVQTFRLAARQAASRKASEHRMVSIQQRAFDAVQFIEYSKAIAHDDERLASFLHERFRPEMRKAVDAWLATRPMKNPAAPKTPFQMAEYSQQATEQARGFEEQGEKIFADAVEAHRISDTYVLLTVGFSTVLFFGGMAGTIHRLRLRWMFGAAAALLLVCVLVALLGMPICREMT
jgi:hypothetical protein